MSSSRDVATRAALAGGVLTAGLALAAPLSHCSTSASCAVNPTDYDQSCITDSDCVAVASGTYCGGACTCDNAAINAQVEAQYQSDLDLHNPPRCNCPAPPAAACVAFVCTLAGDGAGAAVTDAGSD